MTVRDVKATELENARQIVILFTCNAPQLVCAMTRDASQSGSVLGKGRTAHWQEILRAYWGMAAQQTRLGVQVVGGMG